MSSNCIVCNRPLTQHLEGVIDPFTHDRFSIEKCTNCGLGHTLPHPEQIERYYDPVYYGNRHGLTSRFCAKRRARIVSHIMGGKKNGALLDVGCGDGAFLLEATEKGWQCVGTERNPALPRKAGLIVEETIAEATPSGPYDCVTFWHSLEHMGDPLSMLIQVSEVLASSGRLIIAVPDNGGLQARIFSHKWLHLDVPRHLYHFDCGALSHLLKSAGFTIVHQYHQEFEYDLLGWSQSALNFISPPNAFFNLITGKMLIESRSSRLFHWALGMIGSLLSIPAVWVGSLLGRGGTLIIAAEPGSNRR
ncbi:MAG: class I SAM-dependent methyltransferase [Desulfobacterales bacterium]